MIYNSRSHEQHEHPKHSLLHCYSQSGEYLGHRDNLNLVHGSFFDAHIRNGDHVVYEGDIGTTTIYAGGDTNKPSVYENVYSQQIIILGSRKIR